ncbi:MAG: glutamate racemase [Pseudomonadota bacterium]
MPSLAQLPIGIFDSGVGGLTVARAVMQRLPHERILYFGDTARVPYGVKSPDTIRHFARQITAYLLEQRVKLLIVACNTMAAVAVEEIQKMSPVPVLNVLAAGARYAAHCTRTGHIGVIGTLATINSHAYDHALHALTPTLDIHSQACPLFVPLVEEGWLDHPVTRLVAQEYLQSLLAKRIDTLILGCTHYPLLKPLLEHVIGDDVTLVDSAATVADQAAELLATHKRLRSADAHPEHRYCVTDVPQRFQEVGGRFLGRPLHNVELVAL